MSVMNNQSRMRVTIAHTVILTFIFLFSSCYYDNEAELYGEKELCTDTVSGYSARLKGIVDNLCVGCHSSQGGDSPFLTNYSLVYENKDAIICRVVNSPTCGAVMPQSGVIDPCDKQAFELWQQNGFRE
jgi:hypothetical protein